MVNLALMGAFIPTFLFVSVMGLPLLAVVVCACTHFITAIAS